MTEATTPAAETAETTEDPGYESWTAKRLQAAVAEVPQHARRGWPRGTKGDCIAILERRDDLLFGERRLAAAAGLAADDVAASRAASSEKYWAMTLEGLHVEVALVPKGLLAAGDQSTKGGCVAILKERDRQSARVRGVVGVDFVEPPAEGGGPEEQEAEQAATCGTCMVFALNGYGSGWSPCCARHGLPAAAEEVACEEHETAQPEREASSGEGKAEAGAEEADPGEFEQGPGPPVAALTRQEVEEIVATRLADETAPDTRLIKVPLDQASLADLADEMAELTTKIAQLQEEKKKTAADQKGVIDSKLLALQQLGEEVKAGRDEVGAVEVRRYFEANLLVVLRAGLPPGATELLEYRALDGLERHALGFGNEPPPAGAGTSPKGCGACGVIPADSVDADGGPLCLSCAEDMRAQQGEGPAPVCGDCHWWDTMAFEGAGACSKAGPTGAPASEDNDADACEGFALGASLSCKECRRRDDEAFHFESQTAVGEGPCLSYEPEEQAEEPAQPAEPPLTCGTCDHRDADGICMHGADLEEVAAGLAACADHVPARVRCHACDFWASNACAYNMSEDQEGLACSKFKKRERRGAAPAIAGSLPPAPGSPADAPRPPAAPERPEAA